MGTLTITYEKRPLGYRVLVEDTVVGSVFREDRGWWAYSYVRHPNPNRTFPTRKAAAEWLAAASGLWLVTS